MILEKEKRDQQRTISSKGDSLSCWDKDEGSNLSNRKVSVNITERIKWRLDKLMNPDSSWRNIYMILKKVPCVRRVCGPLQAPCVLVSVLMYGFLRCCEEIKMAACIFSAIGFPSV